MLRHAPLPSPLPPVLLVLLSASTLMTSVLSSSPGSWASVAEWAHSAWPSNDPHDGRQAYLQGAGSGVPRRAARSALSILPQAIKTTTKRATLTTTTTTSTSGTSSGIGGLDDLAYFSLGASSSYNRGPGLADINSTAFRYESVVVKDVWDWRSERGGMYLTPIQRQYSCQSCWAMAAVDSVASMTAIARKVSAVPLSAQQACDCGGTGSCCQGGWPEDAYSFIVNNGNITSDELYPYDMADGPRCFTNTSHTSAASITGWELVPAYNQQALMKAVNMQPVLVLISISARDFQMYNTTAGQVRVYNGSCSTEVNHAVLVVGYNRTGNYWIIKNTWATTWGDGGYMYIAMEDGAGKCGMLSHPPMYPVNFPSAPRQLRLIPNNKVPVPAANGGQWWLQWRATATSALPTDACRGVINPCGNGTCYTLGGIARCTCPARFVELVGVPTSKCVPVSPCSRLINPCGAGTCNDTAGDGLYNCQCAPGHIIGSRADGAPTCVRANSSAASTYVTKYGDTCATIMSGYGILTADFTSLNPYLNCSAPLPPGVTVAINSFTQAGCTRSYAVQSKDTCTSIAGLLTSLVTSLKDLTTNILYGTTQATTLTQVLTGITGLILSDELKQALNLLQVLNPLLNCSQLYTSQLICINATRNATADAVAASRTSTSTSTPASALLPICNATYVTVAGNTCASIINSTVINTANISMDQFLRLNPGLNCSADNGRLPIGIHLCMSAGSSTMLATCTTTTRVQQGDTCATLWNAFNLTQAVFMALNPGIRCQAPYLQLGQQVCVNASLVPTTMASQTEQTIGYTVQANDTLTNVVASIAASFARRCTRTSLSLPRIAALNNLASTANVTVNSLLRIPCVPRVGASCGCAPSLPVCGADHVTYQSYCDAQCNYALPVFDSNDPCDACKQACEGRAGMAPNPATACPSNTICGYPMWGPDKADAIQVVGDTPGPRCRFANTTCNNVCNAVAVKLGGTTATRRANYNACYSQCNCCGRLPCGGPSCTLPAAASKGNCTTTPSCSFDTGMCSSFGGGLPCQSCTGSSTRMTCSTFCPAFAALKE